MNLNVDTNQFGKPMVLLSLLKGTWNDKIDLYSKLHLRAACFCKHRILFIFCWVSTYPSNVAIIKMRVSIEKIYTF